MTALWSWGTTPIYVEEDEFSREAYNAVLKVLSASVNTIQNWGGGSERRNIKGVVVGQTNKDAILIDAASGTTRTLTSDQGSEGDFVIDGEVKATRVRHAGATIDGTSHDATTPIYRMEFFILSTD